MSVVKSLTANVNFWYNYGELSTICNEINNKISDRVIINNIKTNTIANPKSTLNLLNLGLNAGDKIEIIIMSDSELHANITERKIKEIFGNNLVFVEGNFIWTHENWSRLGK